MSSETRHRIVDRHGASYQVLSFREDYSWDFFINHHSSRIGRVLCTQEPGHLNLGDVHLYDDLLARETFTELLWRKLRGRPPPTVSYRNRGIGSAMLVLLEQLAAKAGYRRIEGWISKVDAEPNPGLFDWYRHRGYTVVPASDLNAMQVASLSKTLNPR